MIHTTLAWTPAILSRFHNFDDAVVREVRLAVGSSRARRSATIVLEARDHESREGDGWGRVVLKVSEVTEYRFVENEKDSSYVLSLGLKIQEFDGIDFFDFGPDTDEPDSLEDFRRSQFYVAGRSYSWGVKPYPKSWSPSTRAPGPAGLTRRRRHPSSLISRPSDTRRRQPR